MTVVIRLSRQAELKALPILCRHSPGMMLPQRTYVIRAEVARALREAGVPFVLVCQDERAPDPNQGRRL